MRFTLLISCVLCTYFDAQHMKVPACPGQKQPLWEISLVESRLSQSHPSQMLGLLISLTPKLSKRLCRYLDPWPALPATPASPIPFSLKMLYKRTTHIRHTSIPNQANHRAW